MRDPESALGQLRVGGHGGRRAQRPARGRDHIGEILPVQAQHGRAAIRHEREQQAAERVSQAR